MEYKMGQRVKHEDGTEWYVKKNKGEFYWLSYKPGEKAARYSHHEVLSPLFKPGDKVRVIATEEELEKYHLDKYCTTGAIIPVDEYLPGIIGSEIISYDYHVPLAFVEWHSGVEDKPARLTGVDLPNPERGRSIVVKNIQDIPIIVDGNHIAPGETYTKQNMDVIDFLPVEVHQDKARNKAVLAEVLDYNGLPVKKWKCPNHTTYSGCKFTGTMEQLEEHMRKDHPGEKMPSRNSPCWIKWQVS